MQKRDPLRPYREKRDFSLTPEPPGDELTRGSNELACCHQMFVVHKHRSTSLHYDLRLEVDGVLRCWAIPRGLSSDSRDRRLAIQTEDHPLAYLDFEGVIPAGEYGAGAVIVWDIGRYENITEKNGPVPFKRALENGHIVIKLEGMRIHGAFALTRTGVGKDSRWLIVKKLDEAATAGNVLDDDQASPLSGLSVEDLAELDPTVYRKIGRRLKAFTDAVKGI
jgi:DNA ligase D-like protein (predicted 3'-phosphoesterase)